MPVRKILIIEDDMFLQGLEVNKLIKNDYEVVTAGTGEDAMKKILEPGLNLILLDLILPNFDGFEVLKKIKETKELENIPVIVFSNLSEDKDIEKAKNLGVRDFMIKSNFSLEELVERINQVLK